jgi:5-methylcytosine-specific restriction enzyme A
MAVTRGHGNPNWTRDETILALELYLSSGGQMPSPRSPEVVALSKVLRSLPYYAEAARKPSFRNPDGVVFKLQNIRQVATGRGLGNVSQMDRAIWAEFGNNRTQVARLANAIRAGVITERTIPEVQDEEFSEGRLLTILHYRRERDPKLRAKSLQEALFEAHHVLPLASGERTTKLKDLVLLCACCHRVVHKLMVTERRVIGIPELARVISKAD